MKKSIKAFVKKGLTSIKWKYIPNGVYCFNYHRIGDSRSTSYDSDIYSCDNEVFESHIEFYKNNYDLISVDDLEKIIDTEEASKNRLALITFDDGYIDNYTNAYQILKSNAVPAVFFVPTSYIGSKLIPWWDEIAWMVRRTRLNSVKIAQWERSIDLDKNNIEKTIRAVLLKVKKTKKTKMDTILEQMRVVLECQIEEPLDSLFMNWDQLREMQKGGMGIGSHTHSHEILSHISAELQLQELAQSKKILDRELNTNISSFAYPVGRVGTYTNETIEALKVCGYKLAFTQLLGINKDPREQRFELRRFPVDGNIEENLIPQLVCLS